MSWFTEGKKISLIIASSDSLFYKELKFDKSKGLMEDPNKIKFSGVNAFDK